MNLTQLQENFVTLLSKDNKVEIVEKAVELANACQQMRKYDAAISCLNKADVAEDAGLHAVINTALGTACWEKAQLQKALNHFEEALKLFKQVDDRKGMRAVLSIVGITFWRKCDWNQALVILKDALIQNEDKEKDQRFVSLYGALDRGIVTLRNRVRLGRELRDPLKILQPLFSSSALYLITGDLGEMRSSLDESDLLARQLEKKYILKASMELRKLVD